MDWHAGGYGLAKYWVIGIALLPNWRGRGIGWRAQTMLCDYLFVHSGRADRGGHPHPENIAEQKSLEKAGFQREGVLRSVEFRNRQWRDGWIYSRLRGDPVPTQVEQRASRSCSVRRPVPRPHDRVRNGYRCRPAYVDVERSWNALVDLSLLEAGDGGSNPRCQLGNRLTTSPGTARPTAPGPAPNDPAKVGPARSGRHGHDSRRRLFSFYPSSPRTEGVPQLARASRSSPGSAPALVQRVGGHRRSR